MCIFAQIVKISEDYAPVTFHIQVEERGFSLNPRYLNDVENAVASRFCQGTLAQPLEEPALTADDFNRLANPLLFGVATLLVLASALMVVLSRHPVYSALYLVLTFVGLSVFFLQLSAPFLAAVQVIVYAGAIMVLFVFVIMLLGEDKPIAGESGGGARLPLGIIFGLVMVLMLGYLMSNPSQLRTPENQPMPQVATLAAAGEQPVMAGFGSVRAIGNTLFTDYLFAFEATSIVLLVAMIGVVVLAKKRL